LSHLSFQNLYRYICTHTNIFIFRYLYTYIHIYAIYISYQCPCLYIQVNDYINSDTIRAFVTFEFSESMARCIEDYNMSNLNPFYYPKNLKFRGCKIKVYVYIYMHMYKYIYIYIYIYIYVNAFIEDYNMSNLNSFYYPKNLEFRGCKIKVNVFFSYEYICI
jgi:hypothetical protein